MIGQRLLLGCGVMAMFLTILAGVGAAESVRVILDAKAFGLHADGKTDDGPVLQAMLERAAGADGGVTLRFPGKSRIYLAQGRESYAFRLQGLNDLEIDGGGSTFVVHKDLRFLKASGCRGLTVKNLSIDVTPSPVVEATVLTEAEGGKELTLRLDEPGRAGELGGPTGEKGEQAFFAVLWAVEGDWKGSQHYYPHRISEVPGGAGSVRVEGREALPGGLAGKAPGCRISLPVPGVAHRAGPGAMIVIDGCDGVCVEEVEIWSAPWFAYQIFRNRGELVFRRCHIRPQPGSGRVTSVWRDGFHVKGNSGRLLFEGCILEGMNDDSFNVSNHGSKVTEVAAPDRIVVRQVFPIQYMPMNPGGELLIIDSAGARRSGARIRKIVRETADPSHPERAPELELLLDRPVNGIGKGCFLWDLSSSNPQTTIRRCRIGNSCRFQSPVTVENCQSEALLLFYSDHVEGPMPAGSVIRNCVLTKGRGNRRIAVVFKGRREENPNGPGLEDEATFPLRDILIESCEIDGEVSATSVSQLILRNNRLKQGPDSLRIRNCPGHRVE